MTDAQQQEFKSRFKKMIFSGIGVLLLPLSTAEVFRLTGSRIVLIVGLVLTLAGIFTLVWYIAKLLICPGCGRRLPALVIKKCPACGTILIPS